MLFCWRSTFAALGALLWVGAFSPAWLMGLPNKDASLLQPGLLLILRIFAENRQQWLDRARASAWLALGAVIAGTLLTLIILLALKRTSEPSRPRLLPTFDSIARQLVTVGASWVLVLFASYMAQKLVRLLPPLVYQLLGEKGADGALVVVALLLVSTILLVRVACDLTRAALVRSEQPIAAVVTVAIRELRSRWRFWVGSYVCLVLPMLGLPLLAQASFPFLAEGVHFSLGRTLAHQGVVLASCVLQLAWWVLTMTRLSVPPRPPKRQDEANQ
jgi:hypothetical protein